MVRFKKVLSLLLCLIMVLSNVPVQAFAAGGASNVTMSVDQTEVNVGDTVSVTVNCTGMKVSSFTAGIVFDRDLLEIESIVSDDPEYPEDFGLYASSKGGVTWVPATAISTVAQAKNSGQVGFAFAGTKDTNYTESILFTATFTAKKEGNAVFTLYEDTAGADEYKSSSVATSSVTITKPEEGCSCSEEPHALTVPYSDTVGTEAYNHYYEWTASADGKLTFTLGAGINCVVSGPDGNEIARIENSIAENTLTVDVEKDVTYDINVWEGYGDTGAQWSVSFEETVTHTCTPEKQSGQAATCAADGWNDYYKCSCGKLYSDAAGTTEIPNLDAWKTGDGKIPASGHTYGDLIEATDAVHNQDELKPAVAAHYYCAICKTYFDTDKNETTLEKLTGETPTHTESTKTETTDATCTVGGKVETVTFCTECGKELRRETTETLPAGHSWGAVSYDWSADGKTCTAQRVCQTDENHQETETVTATGVVTTPATCGEKGTTTYTANFVAEWAVDGQTTTRQDVDATGNHAYVPGEYTWNGTESCTVIGTCACSATATATSEKVESKVTTTATCKVNEVVTYTATFSESWATTQTKEVTGEVDKNNHASDEFTYECNRNGTHKKLYACCREIAEAAEKCEGIFYCTGIQRSYGSENGEKNFELRFYCETCRKNTLIDGEDAEPVVQDGTCLKEATTTYVWDFSRIDEDVWSRFRFEDDTADEWGYTWNAETKTATLVETGSKDLTKHESEEVTYKNITATTHDEYHKCCGNLKAANVPHTYVDGYCACEKAKTLPVVVDALDYQKDVTFTLSNPTATFGQDYVTTVTPDKGTDVLFGGTNALVQYCTFDEESNTLTIPANAITADMEEVKVRFVATVKLTLDPNGGEILDDIKDALIIAGAVIEDGKITLPATYGSSGQLTVAGQIHYEGHTYVGYTDADGKFHGADETYTNKEDDTLTLIWKCNSESLTHHEAVAATCTEGGNIEHWECTTCGKLYSDADATTEVADVTTPVAADAHDWQDNGYTIEADTHTKNYVCAHDNSHIKSDAAVPHDYTTGTAPHTCICGAVETFTVTVFDSNDNIIVSVSNAVAKYGENYQTTFTNDKNAAVKYEVDGFRVGEEIEWAAFTYEDGVLTIPAGEVTGNIEIFVHALVTVTIDPNGGYFNDPNSGESVDPIVKDVNYGGSISNVDPTKAGYTLTGLTTNQDGTGDKYTIKQDAEGIEFVGPFTADTTLYAQWEANEYTLTVVVEMAKYGVEGFDEEVNLTVAYGANLLEALAKAEAEGKIPDSNQKYRLISELYNGEAWVAYYYYQVGKDCPEVEEDMTMPAGNYTVNQSWYSQGWEIWDNYTAYLSAEGFLEGWQFIEEDYDDVEGGAWYYFDENCYRAEGLSRVPYPTEPINGKTYAPDADAKAYYESKGKTFIDAEKAWFWFDENGKFLSGSTGIVPSEDGPSRYAVNGMLTWHPGLVNIDGEFYYFEGDETNGGNIMATGDVYVTHANGHANFVEGGVYTFAEDGKLYRYHGITDMANGTKRYYENWQLMLGAGLVDIHDVPTNTTNYFYVRSNGELVVGTADKPASYWVSKTNGLNIVAGMYDFDENGYMINPVTVDKDGIYYENGGWFYYENGVKSYNKGLIMTDKVWYDADGNTVWGEGGIIYVRSNGQLATGAYYVSNLTNYDQTIDVKSGDRLEFTDMGLMMGIKNGIVAEAGGLFYYVNGVKGYNAGVIELDGKYYYVRSNGQLATGDYWITNTGNTGILAKKYTFAADGTFTPEYPKSGVVDGYYYEDGRIKYAAGVVDLIDEAGNTYYIYVRSNGAVATGSYWATNTNGKLDSKMYNWGEDGRLYL